ncbi:hypothetical protein BS015_RS15975 [Vibrio parahaemolyticus]|nr:hypothetical protein [Vibrio parahaemolyticus]EGQ9476649.1 hypothetical protein [Vibrio parahaemolyticus]EJG0185017.1 hypothetical protein [Vibrio parahaemolyticus]EJG0190190.1 hypothetical protein [Vibrio parahaemolyticus]EJG0781421.1 hypothetical protein [Vibrio parahaemolyticus]
MALTQIQVIQSLGESMSWLERELNWGVPITELRHLTGRIGELYSALITNGQMATEVNQSGYDVVSGDGERVSVKTTGRLANNGHVSFNPNTLNSVDRIIVLRINVEEMQIETLFDGSVEQAQALMCTSGSGSKYTLALSKLVKFDSIDRDIPKVKEAVWGDFTIVERENGSIEVIENGTALVPAKPHLRQVAKALGVSILNSNGNHYNTRQLGSLLIRELNA